MKLKSLIERDGILHKSSAVFDQIVQNFDSLFMMYVVVEPSICAQDNFVRLVISSNYLWIDF